MDDDSGADGGEEQQELTSTHEPAPAAGSALVLSDVQLLRQLRATVPGFQLLSKNPVAAELRDQLVLHRGGVSHLDAKWRRKKPAGNEHLLVQAVPYRALLDAWRCFLLPDGGFDATDILSADELQITTRAAPVPLAARAAGRAAAGGGRSSARFAAGDLASIEPYMEGIWFALTRARLGAFKRANAPDILARLRHERMLSSNSSSGTFVSLTPSSLGHARSAADLTTEVTQLMQLAVESLFIAANCPQLFHCMPEDVTCALPDEFLHFWFLSDAGSCLAECGARGEGAPACHVHAHKLAAQILYDRRALIIADSFCLAAFNSLALEQLAPVPPPYWWQWTTDVSVLETLDDLKSVVANDLGLDDVLWRAHISLCVTTLYCFDLSSVCC